MSKKIAKTKAAKKKKGSAFYCSFSQAKKLLLPEEEEEEEKQDDSFNERGVFYDGGWDDMSHGSFTINNWDGPSITQATFNRLRKEKILGGNRLQTYKARKWHPVLKPKEEDKSKLGDLFFRQKPYKSEWELEREDASADVYGTEEVKRTLGDQVAWVPITTLTKLPKGKVLCTNNIEATPPNTNYPPYTTHAWTATLVNRKGQIIGLDACQLDGFGNQFESRTVWGVSHWAPIPLQFVATNRLQLVEKNPYVAQLVSEKIFNSK